MPTFTSVKSGYWNDPTVWDLNAVPANGDSVIVAAGHTVTFNVDQSSFANGLAGLTINGTLKIPSQAEDPSMPNTVVLKVNANIAGSGSFIIGSPTQPITYPQFVKVMVNGTITVATFNAYGEQRSPLWDYLAQDAPSGATTIVLQNGLPLRAGDLIAIGRSDIVGSWHESGSARGLHTVASYNATTKTVTLNEALTHARSGTGVRACLVILLSRQIVISKYGANNVALHSGSGRTFKGVLFTAEAGATFPNWGNSSSTTISYSSFIGAPHYQGGSNITVEYFTAYKTAFSGFGLFVDQGGTCYLNNSAFVNATGDFAILVYNNTTWNASNIYAQNSHINHSAFPGSGFLNNVVCKNANFLNKIYNNANERTFVIYVQNLTIIDGHGEANSLTSKKVIMDGVTFYGFLPLNYFISQIIGASVIKNVTAIHNGSGQIILTDVANSSIFRNCQINAQSKMSNSWQVGNKFINISLSQTISPILTSDIQGVNEIINLIVNTYYRPTISVPLSNEQLHFSRIIVKGLTVAGTQHPRAFEHLFPHGYVKNRWDAATPDYTTFDFILTQSSFAGQPIWLEYQVFTADPIRVTGTITQLGTNESVKVQIFSAGKEPLYGDTPDFEQTYTALGDINVNWTPPDKRTWVVRVLAYLQQTTNPITIANLQVAGGGDGGGQTYNINVTDGITPSLSDAADIVASLMVTDSLNPTLTDQASLSAQIALSDAINPTLQDQSQAQVQVNLSDSINPTLQDIVDLQSGTFYNISVSDQITPSLADSVDEQIAVSVSESISPQLQDQASPSIQISASEMISPTIQEQVYEQAQISVNETIMPTLQDLPTTQVDVSASETIAPTLQEQVNVTAGGTYQIVEPLDIDITEDELEV
jgi:hypothetical protein